MPAPHQPQTIAKIEQLRRQRLSGPAIARQLNMARSTVGTILRRIGLGKLGALEAKPEIARHERDEPGEMIHLDMEKLGRIDGTGHRVSGDRTGQGYKRGTGWECLHVATDDASRLTYSEILPNERTEGALAFSRRP